MIRRLLVALVGVVAIAAVMLLCFPDLRYGPLGTVDPLYARIRLHNIVEIQPLLPADWLSSGHLGETLGRVIKVVGIALFAVPFLGVLLLRGTGVAWRFWATVAVALLAFLPLAFYQVRWASYAEAFLVWPYAAAVAWALSRLARTAGRSGVLLRPLVILAALFWPLLLAAALPQQEIESAGRACPVDRLAAVLNRAAPAPRTLLAYADYGSELLYRTPHRVLSIPNHRPQPGFAATYRILTAIDGRRRAPSSRVLASTGSCCARAPPKGRCSPCPATHGRPCTSAWSMATLRPGSDRCLSKAIWPPRPGCSRSSHRRTKGGSDLRCAALSRR